MLDLDRTIATPQSRFDTPRALLDSSQLTREQKIRALRNWQQDLTERSVATEENMPGPAPETSLGEVEAALRALDADDDGAAPTRHGT